MASPSETTLWGRTIISTTHRANSKLKLIIELHVKISLLGNGGILKQDSNNQIHLMLGNYSLPKRVVLTGNLSRISKTQSENTEPCRV